MKLKKYEYIIEVNFDYKNGLCMMGSNFIIKAVPVDEKQALGIAKILFPDCKNIIIASIKSV